MRNAKLTILAALSLVMLAALAWGYVGAADLDFEHISVTPNGKTGRGAGVGVENGQFDVGWFGGNRIPQSDGRPPGVNVSPYVHFELSLAHDCLWGFHIVHVTGPPGYAGVHLVCPLWFAALPFTIAPLAWLRRRRRREMRGFAVEGSQPLSEHVEMQTDRQTPAGV